jgi:hypothetical protein
MPTHAQVALAWGERRPRSVRAPLGRMVYDADSATVYSYGTHWPLGTWRKDKRGADVIFLNANTCGKATAKHQGHVWREAYYLGGKPHPVPMFWLPAELWGCPKSCLAYLTDKAMKEVARARRARVYRDLIRAREFFADAHEFAQLMGLGRERAGVFRKPDVRQAFAQATFLEAA